MTTIVRTWTVRVAIAVALLGNVFVVAACLNGGLRLSKSEAWIVGVTGVASLICAYQLSMLQGTNTPKF